MNYIDIACLVIIGLYALIGFYRGALRSIVSLVGNILVILLAYYLKGHVVNYLVDDLPVIRLGGIFKGITSVNLLIYHVIAFLTLYIIFKGILFLILRATKLIDRIIKKLVIFELASKIIGAIIGLLEGVVIVFMVSFLMMQFVPTQKYVMDSKVASGIVDKTPIMNSIFKKTLNGSREIFEIIKESGKKSEKNEKIIDSLVDNDFFTKEDIENIIEKGKLDLGKKEEKND